jgi:hypothetical protein
MGEISSLCFRTFCLFVWTQKTKIHLMFQLVKYLYIFFGCDFYNLLSKRISVCHYTIHSEKYDFIITHLNNKLVRLSVCLVKASPFDEIQNFVSVSCRVLNCYCSIWKTFLSIWIYFVCNEISSVWEVTDGTEVRFCKNLLNVRCSSCDGSSTCKVFRGTNSGTVLWLVGKYCNVILQVAWDKLVISCWVWLLENVKLVGIKNKEEL